MYTEIVYLSLRSSFGKNFLFKVSVILSYIEHTVDSTKVQIAKRYENQALFKPLSVDHRTVHIYIYITM